MTEPVDPRALDPAVQRVVDAAARKGVALRIAVLDATTHTAQAAAEALGVDVGQIVKSLVFVVPRVESGHEPVMALVSGRNRVDVARLAAIVGEPSIRRATAREARDLTGFAIGGIPPIGHDHAVRAVMDPDLGLYPEVWSAAGLDRAVFPAAPATLRALANAVVAPIAEVATTGLAARAAATDHAAGAAPASAAAGAGTAAAAADTAPTAPGVAAVPAAHGVAGPSHGADRRPAEA